MPKVPMERYAPGMRILSVDVNFVQNDRRRAHGAERAKVEWSTSSKTVGEKESGPDLARTEAGSSG
jgi:hypothetical protein